jgi:DNA modification methylase
VVCTTKILESRLILGDSLEKLRELPDNSIDLIATDPPYGYSFMGKEWDKALPDKRIWKECLRVLKHGGFAYVLSAPRQDVLARMMIDLEDVGFKTDFTSMYWAYATGFPKALNMSKAVDKKLGVKPDSAGIVKGMGKQNSEWNGKGVGGRKEDYYKPEYEKVLATSKEAKKLDGSYAGFQPKPAVEVIIVCMKPLDEKGYVNQALANGKGVSWFDDCRIPTGDTDKYDLEKRGISKAKGVQEDESFLDEIHDHEMKHGVGDQGRYPANLIVSDDSLDIGVETKSAGGITKAGNSNKVYGKFDKETYTNTPKDKGDFSRYFNLDKWWNDKKYFGRFPANLLVSDKSVDIGKETKSTKTSRMGVNIKGGHYNESDKPIDLGTERGFNDKGDFSRYFDIDKWWEDNKGRYPANLLVSDKALDTGEETKAGKSHVRGGDAFNKNTYGKNMGQFKGDICKEYNDSGGFSRYFDIDKWWETQFIVTPKPSKSEKNKGLEDFKKKSVQPAGLAGAVASGKEKPREARQNIHPTVKPMKLMSYLITLGSREGDVVLDPFLGSGTTALSAKMIGRKYIGIEREPEYYKICCARVGYEPNPNDEINEEIESKERDLDVITDPKEATEVMEEIEDMVKDKESNNLCKDCGFTTANDEQYKKHFDREFHKSCLT